MFSKPHFLSPLDSQTPNDAANALVASARTALQCITRAEVFGSGSNPGHVNALTIVGAGRAPNEPMLLRNRQHQPHLLLDISIEYTVAYLPDETMQQPYRATIANYAYAIQDLSGSELFAYHWHPTGVSHVKTPLMHFNGSTPVRMPKRPGHPDERVLSLRRAHFPTRRIELAAFIRFLIRDLDVEPRRPDWEQVLIEN